MSDLNDNCGKKRCGIYEIYFIDTGQGDDPFSCYEHLTPSPPFRSGMEAEIGFRRRLIGLGRVYYAALALGMPKSALTSIIVAQGGCNRNSLAFCWETFSRAACVGSLARSHDITSSRRFVVLYRYVWSMRTLRDLPEGII